MKNAIILFSCFALLISITIDSSAQTNPAPQTLPYSQNFSSISHATTTYPAGWQGWQIGTTSSTAFRINAPTGDLPLNASSTAATTSGGIHNYNGKLGFLASGSVDVALCLAINMTGLSGGLVVISSNSTIRNPFDGASNTRLNSTTLQFRVGTSGNFATLTGSYTNNTVNQTGAVTTPQNSLVRSFLLPASCNNQPVVQVRWVQKDNSGSGGRPSFAIDDIFICAPIVTPQVSIAQTGGNNPSCFGAPQEFTATPVNGGATPSFQWKVNNTTVLNTLSNIYTSDTLHNNDTVSCTIFTSEQCITTIVGNSNKIGITLTSVLDTPTVSIITNNPSQILCGGTIVTYTATPVNGGSNPSYQWKKNGFFNIGTNSNIYIDSSLTPGSYTLSCVMTSNAYCITSPNTVTSNGISKSVFQTPVAPTGLIASDTAICVGEAVTLYRVGGNAADGIFVYYQDGCVNFFNGGTGSFLGSGDSVVITPSVTRTYFVGIEGICPVTNCDSIVIHVSPNVTPSISITSDYAGVTACQGTIITYTATPVNGGSNPTYQWIKHPNTIVGTGSVYVDSSSVPGNYNLFCVMTSSANCIVGQNPVTSNGKGLAVLENPILPTGITASSTTICAGGSVTLHRVGGSAGSGIFAWYQGGCGNIFNGGSGAFLAGGDSIVVSPSTTTTYYLSAEGLCPLTECLSITITVKQVSVAAASIITSTTNMCQFDDLTLTVNGGSLGTGASWQWMKDSCNGVIIGFGDSITINPSAGIKTFYVKAVGTCNTTACTASDPITINATVDWFRDFDNDGFGNNANVINACTQPVGFVLTGGDCNDNNGTINPGATEICGNGIDENCNGMSDDVCAVTLNLKIYFEAYYLGNGLMSAILNPVSLPGICDSVTVELHDFFSPYDMAYTVTSTISINGNGVFTFPLAALNNSYYVVVKHRNSIETWSKNPVLFNVSVKDFDFTTP